jgi:hypothetical protein
MNPLACPRDRAPSPTWFVFAPALMVALLSVGLTGCFRVGSDAQALRDSVMKSTSGNWDEEIEIGVGALTLGLARAGLSFVDVDPEARTVLDAVRGAEVGVYKLRSGRKTMNRSAILAAADKAMDARGWDRVVGVMDGREFVAVFVPKKLSSPRNFKVCVLVLNGGEMVVASARSNLEPLMELAFEHKPWGQFSGPF